MADTNERDVFVHAHQFTSADEREAYLKDACAGRPELLDRIRTLLLASARDDGLLAAPAFRTTIVPSETAPSEGPGDLIGRYKLLERIGEGGMAVVYMAEQESPVRRKVALKIIKLGMDTENVIARFEAERQALALMDHPYIAKIFDGGATEKGRPYFVMELVRGAPITDYCDKNRLGTRARLELFIQVCDAVQHAHQKSIIHRDLKPSNILVTLYDGKPVPKVIDFGIAKATGGHLTEKTLFTGFHAFIGTPAYTSPEQAQMSSQDIDTRADIYALGAVLYELLTGRTPFEQKELARSGLEEYLRTIREIEPARPSTRVSTLAVDDMTTLGDRRQTEPVRLVRQLRSDLDWIAMKCLEKDRTRRYDTASALAQDIRHYLDGEAVLARPPSTAYLAKKFIRRNKFAVIIASVVCMAAIVSTWQAIRATRAVWEQDRLRGKVEAALLKEGQQRRLAEADERIASRRAYTSDMTLAHQALGANNYGRVVGLLDRYRPKASALDLRQWEWRYFWNQSRSQAAFFLPQQPDAIAGLALSPDHRLLVSTDLSGKLKLWDLSKKKELFVLDESGLDPRVFSLSHDGTRLATVTRKGFGTVVKVWAVAQRKSTHEIRWTGQARTVSFTVEDSALLIVGQDLAIDKWDLQTDRIEPVVAARPKTRLEDYRAALAPDFSRIAFVSGPRIHVLDMATGTEIADLEGFQEGIWSLAFSPDGKQLAAGPTSSATSTNIKLFSLESKQMRELVGHVSWVPALTFTSDGSRLVSAGADQSIRIWNVELGQQESVLHGHLSEIYRVAVSTDGKTIVSGGKDGAILAWDATPIQQRSSFDTLPNPVKQIAFLADFDEMLSVDSDGGASLWDSASLVRKESVTILGRELERLLVSSDGARVYVGTRHGAIRVVDWPTRQLITTIDMDSGSGPQEPVGLIDQDRTLVVVAGKSTVRLIDTQSCQTRTTWKIRPDGSWRVGRSKLSATAGLLVSGGIRGPLQFMNLGTGKSQTVGDSEPWGASDLAFTSDGRILATSSLEGIIRLWDTSSHQVIDVLRGHLIGVNVVTFSPDGDRLASGSQGVEAVKLWDVSTRQEVATLPGEGLMSGSLGFSPDGKLLVGINGQGKAHIWRAPSLAEISAAESQPVGQ